MNISTMDSDSDNDILTNNVFTGQNINTTVCAKGPNMTSLSFRNQIPTSSMHMPRNMQPSRYASSLYDQSSVRSRRDISPMSVRSAYEFQPRNFNMSHYPRGMSSQRSVTNGRSRSPMSMSIASTSSVSAVDIAQALKNAQFNKHEWKLISDAYKKYEKFKIRKKFEKRRKLRMYLKGARHRSGGESGEQGSDSSISDDDCRSTSTSIFKGNMSSRSTRTDLTKIRRTMQESNMYNDCSANFKQKSFQNMFSIDSGSLNPNIYNKSQNVSLQKDRFKSGFLLPSQRFNKSVAASTIPENMEKQHRNIYQKSTKENVCSGDKRSKNFMSTTDSENDEIFAEAPIRQKQLNNEPQRKRSLEKDEETQIPHNKKNKLSPIKKISDDKIGNKNRNTDQSVNNKDDFVFAKPSFPIKKIANLKIKEKLLAKSPNVNNIFEKRNTQQQNHIPTVQHTMIIQEKVNNQSKELDTTKHSNTDVSMRPSFIKRKLFTQKLDVAENKILSSDNENSPKTVYSGIQKEKNKARKLVTNQSCLSRDVLQDDNYLDLIHKIVPPNQMNSTSQPNKSDIQRKSKDVDDKWDATSVISICNNDNVSDTYTDEDIFQDNNNPENKKDNKSANNTAVAKNKQNCKILLDRLPLNELPQKNIIRNNHTLKVPSNAANVNKNEIKTCAKSFWDTDLESDFECQETHRNINKPHEPQVKSKNSRVVAQQAKKSEPNPTAAVSADISLLNNTTATVNKFNNTSISIRSHRVPKKKKCCEELDQSNSSLYKTQNKKSKDLSCLSYTAFVNNVKINNAAKVIPEDKSKNGRAIRSCRTPKQNLRKTTDENDKTEANRSLRSRKGDLSRTLDGKAPTKCKSKKQTNNSKQSNHSTNKQTEKTKPAVNSRNSDVSFSLKSDLKTVKTKKVAIKKTESANNSRERKPRQSNISFSITSDSPLTRSRAAILSNEKQKGKRNNSEVNNNYNKHIPVKSDGKNGVINIVHDSKSNKTKSIRKR